MPLCRLPNSRRYNGRVRKGNPTPVRASAREVIGLLLVGLLILALLLVRGWRLMHGAHI